jgi:hypothetical protein
LIAINIRLTTCRAVERLTKSIQLPACHDIPTTHAILIEVLLQIQVPSLKRVFLMMSSSYSEALVTDGQIL